MSGQYRHKNGRFSCLVFYALLPYKKGSKQASSGLTLVEVLVSVVIYSIIMGGLYQVVSAAMVTWNGRKEREQLRSEGEWAMEEMVRHVRGSAWVLLPLIDTTPRSVLAVAEEILDVNQDGVLDGDNDGDGRVNEDWSDDLTGDGEAGIIGIDDDFDGTTDEGNDRNDDEESGDLDDPIDGSDNDGDGRIDEDPIGTGVDEDGDGTDDEDPVEPVVFYYDSTNKRLIERLPEYSTATPADFTEVTIANNVARFEVERITSNSGVLIKIKLNLETATSNEISLNTRVLSRKYP